MGSINSDSSNSKYVIEYIQNVFSFLSPIMLILFFDTVIEKQINIRKAILNISE